VFSISVSFVFADIYGKLIEFGLAVIMDFDLTCHGHNQPEHRAVQQERDDEGQPCGTARCSG
jgi:hypothetical protein